MFLNTEKLKKFNIDLIRSAIKSEEFITKNDLSLSTGLSVATCGNALDELLFAGEVLETGYAESTGGRPSRRFSYNYNYISIAAIYARIEKGVKRIHYTVFNLAGESLYEKTETFSQISVMELENIIRDLMSRFDNMEAISLGVPGIVHKGVIGICELEKLSHLHLKRHWEKKFNKIITIENDVNCTSLGFYHTIKNRNPESLVYIYYAEGGLSGAGIVVNGRVLKGSTDFAGEVSFLPLGVKQKKQGQLQKNPDRFIDLVNKTVQSVNCIINPECIVLSSHRFTQEIKGFLLEKVEENSPPGQIPQIQFEEDIHDSYLNGLKIAAMQKLSCGFEVIPTRE